MRTILGINAVMAAIFWLTGYSGQSLLAQGGGFSRTYFFEERSTVFHAVRQYQDDLIVLGQMGTDTFGNNGVFIARMDTVGNVQDLRIFQDPENVYSLNLVLGGLFGSTEAIVIHDDKIYFAGKIRNGVDLFLICLEDDLKLIFFKQYQSIFPYSRYPGQILVLNNELYTVGFGKNSNIDYDILILKTDLEGNQIWDKSYGNNVSDFGSSAVAENGGLTVLATRSYDPGSQSPNNDTWFNHIIHFDTSGNVLWTLKTNNNEEGRAPDGLMKLSSDYYYITTPTYEDGIGSGAGTIHRKPQIVCRDKDFNLKWRKDYGEYYNWNIFTSMTYGPDSFLYASGYIPVDYTWGRVVKVDPEDGEVIWDARDTAFVIPGWGSRNRMEGVMVLPSGSVIAVGYTVDPTFHENGLLYKITADGCIDTLCTTVNIEELIRNPDQRVRLYPNPAGSEIFIDSKASLSSAALVLYDLQGRHIDRYVLTEGRNHLTIDPSRYAAGLYVWKATAENGQIIDTGKIVIMPDE